MVNRVPASTSGKSHQNLELMIPATGARAQILTSYGFNLHSLHLPLRGRLRQLLAAEVQFSQQPSAPARSGWPVLFPFPNRIAAGAYHFNGVSYQIPHPGKPHANHGFALDAPWEVIDQGSDHPDHPTSAWVEGRFRLSEHAPHARAGWPADAELRLKYVLTAHALSLEATVINPDTIPLPFGLGFHPYFRLPIDRPQPFGDGDRLDGLHTPGQTPPSEPAPDPARTRLTMPVTGLWQLQENLPTGEVRPLDGARDLATGLSRAQMALDDVFTGLQFEAGRCRVLMEDLTLGAAWVLEVGAGFRELVVYTPPAWPDVVAVEPYTQTTNAINLQAQGIDGGLQVLAPGESRRYQLRLYGEELPS